MTEHALAISSDISVVQNGGSVVVGGAVDVTFIAFGHNTFKLQGSLLGSGFSDIANSHMNSDTTLAHRCVESCWRPLAVDTIKVVLDEGYCVVIRRWLRTTPPGDFNASYNMNNIDPQLGTA